MLVLVPGHGPVCRGDEVIRLLDDLEAYAAHVGELVREGHAAGKAKTRFDSWQESERLVGNLHRAYSELDGNDPEARLDVARVWGDMVAFNGGPIQCFA